MKLHHQLNSLDKKYEKSKKYEGLHDDLDEVWIAEWEEQLEETEIEKATKKFDKENEKRAADGEKPQGQEVLEERLGRWPVSGYLAQAQVSLRLLETFHEISAIPL